MEFHKYAREQLPESFIFMSTNGLLLDVEKVKTIVPYVNQQAALAELFRHASMRPMNSGPNTRTWTSAKSAQYWISSAE